MEKLIVANNQIHLAAAVSVALCNMVTAANGRMRERAIDGEDFARYVSARMAESDSGLSMESGDAVANVYKYRAYATTAGVAWARLTVGNTVHYVARVCVERVSANGNVRYAFPGGTRVWTSLGAVLGLTRGTLGLVGLSREHRTTELNQLIIRAAATHPAALASITKIRSAISSTTKTVAA